MNARHKRFCDEYLANGMNATQAYKKTYGTKKQRTAEVNGDRLLSNAEVKEYIESQMKELGIVCGVRKQDLVRDLLTVKERCLQQVAPSFAEPGSFVFDSRSVIAAIAQLSKMLGFDAAIKSEVELNDKTQIKKSIENIQDAIRRAKNVTEGAVS